MLGLGKLSNKIFPNANDRKVKSVRSTIDAINALEPEFQALSDSELIDRTGALKDRCAAGESLEALLPQAFANCREAARRALGLRAFDVQLLGGIFMHQGNIAEMKTGEGKTLVATFPAYLNALTGKGVHIVTVNDYLAKRDADWMGKVFAALGMTTGVVYPQQPDSEKSAAYQCDITYATNNELAFDYLRDNSRTQLTQLVQRNHYFAIVDEVDSILIDEARTPLIISGPSEDRTDLYTQIDKLIPDVPDEGFTIDEKTRQVNFNDEGIDLIETILQDAGILPEGQNLYAPESVSIVHHVNQGLRAHKLFTRDKDYIVMNDEVVLIDEFTGRMMSGRRLSDGLHQAIEAKENCTIKPENVTHASVTFQNYFRLYDKLAGMTGTAMTEAEEFGEIYRLGVVAVPTNQPVCRIDDDDQVFRTTQEKYKAIVDSVKAAHEKGQPVLVGTTSIEKSEALSSMLKSENLVHSVLNARHHEQEAQIVADAGKPGAITIATNMAGRGTDIKLGGNIEIKVLDAISANPDADPQALRSEIEAQHKEDESSVKAAGGLFVLATERHESRRIDNQLRGRSGRQGDPGRSSFFLSLEDDLLRIFGSERLEKILSTLGMEEGEAIVHPWVNKSLERAQAKVEARNFDIRKQLLKFDDVMNEQRKVIFSQRKEIMGSDDISEVIQDMREEVIEGIVNHHMPENSYPDQWDGEGLAAQVKEQLNLDLPVEQWIEEEGVENEHIVERIDHAAREQMAKKAIDFGDGMMRQVEKQILLGSIDKSWREHLLTLERLRQVIGFRGYAQRDPLNEYKTESFQLFEALLEGLRTEVTRQLSLVRPISKEEQEALLQRMLEQQRLASGGKAAPPTPPAQPTFNEKDRSTWGNPGRNTPCPCGSGKKFKHCHGRYV